MGARFLLAMIVGFSGCAGNPKHPYLPFAIDAAAEQKKPLIVEFSATWCRPCRIFAEKVLPDPRVQEALRDVIFVSYDIDTVTGRDAAARCRVGPIPTVVGIDRDGKIRLQKTGTEPTADEFLVFLRQAHEVLAP